MVTEEGEMEMKDLRWSQHIEEQAVNKEKSITKSQFKTGNWRW